MEKLQKIPAEVLVAYVDREVEDLCAIVDRVLAVHLAKKPARRVEIDDARLAAHV